MKTIFLHAGLHKTGTTTFQRFLRTNASNLSGTGLFTPSLGEKYGPRDGGHHSLSRQIEGITGTAKRQLKRRDRKWEDLLSDFEDSNCRAMIVSSEGFSRFGERELETLKEVLQNYTIVPILTFRHPISLITARYCSLGGGRQPIDPRSFFIRRTGHKLHQYGDIINIWTNYFGSNCKFLRYENHPDIIEGICRAVSFEKPNDFSTLDRPDPLRKSLPIDLALLNHSISKEMDLDSATYYRNVYCRIVEFQYTNEYREFSDSRRCRFALVGKMVQSKVLRRLESQIDIVESQIEKNYSDVIYYNSIDGRVPGSSYIARLRECFNKADIKEKILRI